MIVRIVAVGAVLPQPALGLGGRPEAPSPPVLASPGFDPSGALASIDEEPPEPPVAPPEPPEPTEPPEPAVAPPEPPVPVVDPALVDEVVLDVVCETVLEPPAPPAPVVVVAVELGVPGVDGDESSEHAAAAEIEMPTRIEPKILRMGGSCSAGKGLPYRWYGWPPRKKSTREKSCEGSRSTQARENAGTFRLALASEAG
jgi:hypothetical protein